MITFIVMDQIGLTANLMSLGGLVVAIGMMVDGSVVVVENVYRHLAEQRHGRSAISLASLFMRSRKSDNRSSSAS